VQKSHYAAYVKERWNKEVLENADGFAVYRFLTDGVFIEDIYVTPEKRSTQVAFNFANNIAELARIRGLKKMYGTVCIDAPYTEINLQKYFKYGFRVLNLHHNIINLVKEL
jgi:GNAT superfamily N-acetyltransferase